MLLHPSPGLCFLSFSQRQTPDPGNETLSKELKAKGKDATQWLKDGWFVRKTKWECMTCGESTAYPWGIFATHATLLGTRISRLKACLSRWWFSELRVWWGPWIRETWGYTIQVLWFQIGWKKRCRSTQIFDRWICWDCGVGRLKNELKTTKHPKKHGRKSGDPKLVPEFLSLLFVFILDF